MDQLIGRLLGKRYEILEKVGGGGWALVYRAQDTFLHRPVAVKILRSQYTADDDFVRRFKREAQAAASLFRSDVVSIYDVGQEDDVYYIVMEYIDGQTLKEKIDAEAPLPIAVAVKIALQILDALDHAHQAKIVHRDIKPHNILLTKSGRVKVTDFGIARAATTTTLTHTGSIIGSAHYFSPEQARGGFTGEKSDIYSVGVVLYEMVTGRVPFEGDSPISVAIKHIQEDVPRPAQINPAVPVELEEIILRAMEKDQGRRYQSAAEMQADLNRFLKDLSEGRTHVVIPPAPVAGTPPGAGRAERHRDPDSDETKPIGPPPRRSRVRFWALAVGVLILGLLVGLGLGAMYKLLRVPEVVVPDVVGLRQTDAQDAIVKAGLRYKVTDQRYDPQRAAGEIIEQKPAANEIVKQGRTVNLVVSLGKESAPVPNVVGKMRDEAENLIQAAGFVVGKTVDRNDPAPAGTVLEQVPRGDSTQFKGNPVDLFLSTGRVEVMMPDLVRKPLDEAKRILAEQKLELDEQRQEFNPQFGFNEVTAQEPAANTPVPQGTRVKIRVNPPANIQGPKTVNFLVPGTGDIPVEVTAVVQDVRGNVIAYRQFHKPNTIARIPLTWQGDQAIFRIFVNGVFQKPEGKLP
ncbi:MAG: Stk1 family PASTA domain-containing Ser/Thr kinase [Actinobacteria bacterium]|nr:Stk1 family PASTA domain-containing Ser/Thr kinase [Actinomycetota bacterium]